MKAKFEIVLLEETWNFLDSLDDKTKEKIIYNLDKARYINDPELLKKLDEDIWEFRTLFHKAHYRLFAFWDKTNSKETLVITTHGIIKKTGKTPKSEIEKSKAIMKLYFTQKTK